MIISNRHTEILQKDHYNIYISLGSLDTTFFTNRHALINNFRSYKYLFPNFIMGQTSQL